MILTTVKVRASEFSFVATSKNPITDSLSNTHYNHSFTNLYAFINESIFKHLNSKDSKAARVGELFVYTYSTAFFTSFSHEWAHYRVSDYYNLFPNIKINAYGGAVSHVFHPSIDTNTRIITAGLNQQAHNAEYIFDHMVGSGNISYFNGINFMANNLGTVGYSLITLLGYDSSGNDITNYSLFTSLKGYNITTEQMFLFSTLSFFSSVAVWQSLGLMGSFVKDNQRSTKLFTFFDLIAPPLIQYYLTEHGDFLSLTLPFLKPTPIFLHMTASLRDPGFRLGLRSQIRINPYFSLRPFYYFTYLTKRPDLAIVPPDFSVVRAQSLNKLSFGHSFGGEIQVDIVPKSYSLLFNLKYSRDDLMDNMKIDKGLNLSLGMMIRY